VRLGGDADDLDDCCRRGWRGWRGCRSGRPVTYLCIVIDEVSIPAWAGYLFEKVVMATMEKEDRPRARRWFLDEFKTDPVAMVLDGARKIVDDAEAIGVGEGAVRNWVRREGIERGERPGLT
jgi:hypothetical protein